jgi:hypothetical protein
MAKPEDDKPRGGGRDGDGPKGQNKTYTVRNPDTGEVRTVTQREWREQKLGQAGFVKPEDLSEDDSDDDTQSSGGTNQ